MSIMDADHADAVLPFEADEADRSRLSMDGPGHARFDSPIPQPAKRQPSCVSNGVERTGTFSLVRGMTGGGIFSRGLTGAFTSSKGLQRASSFASARMSKASKAMSATASKAGLALKNYSDGGVYQQTTYLKEMLENALDKERTSYQVEMEARLESSTNWALCAVLFPCCVLGAAVYAPLAGLTPLGFYSMQALVLIVNLSGSFLYGGALIVKGHFGEVFSRMDYWLYGIPPTTMLTVATILCGVTFQHISGSIFTALYSMRFVMMATISLAKREEQVPVPNLQIVTLITCLAMYVYICFANGAFVSTLGLLLSTNHNTMVTCENFSSARHFKTGLSALQAAFVNSSLGAILSAFIYLFYDVLALGHGFNLFEGMNVMVLVYGANFLFCNTVFLTAGGLLGTVILSCATVCAMVFAYAVDVFSGMAEYDSAVMLCLISVTCACFQIILIKVQLEKQAALLAETQLLVERCLNVINQV